MLAERILAPPRHRTYPMRAVQKKQKLVRLRDVDQEARPRRLRHAHTSTATRGGNRPSHDARRTPAGHRAQQETRRGSRDHTDLCIVLATHTAGSSISETQETHTRQKPKSGAWHGICLHSWARRGASHASTSSCRGSLVLRPHEAATPHASVTCTRNPHACIRGGIYRATIDFSRST